MAELTEWQKRRGILAPKPKPKKAKAKKDPKAVKAEG